MERRNTIQKPISFIRELCKNSTSDEIIEAEQNFREFLLVINEIATRIEGEGKSVVDFVE
ncbi:MAG: hypothetical protein IPO62_17830 [Saprospiraceae bacterium]|nr:hypothetical protein [Saprospiraceae bacterium]